ncbi:hypothetical protein [Moraxella catarrhalis]|uniref:Uncharacterized protein n=1 Tax=Moraxella catarrhalis TaxID=480 RepID=A0A198UH51_MORCA|nr:hypothetical protein [Moraxella catarrhalis]OAU94978.1 hypothetical protein AO383_2000 [Moraxella catarrhalis]OAU95726.1 hypothetical protein AO384_1332 [Moraxella catarrhalis]
MSSLFRPEALSAQKIDWAGKVVIVTPISLAYPYLLIFLHSI